MGEQHNPRFHTPVTTSVGCSRIRTLTVTVTPTGFSRSWEGATKWYRTQTITTSYAGMRKDNPAPTPDTTYTVTPAVTTDSVDRGWNLEVSANGDTTTDNDSAPTTSTTPDAWTPALVGSPTWGAATVSETETTYTETRPATGIWSGTQTYLIEWSDEITAEDMEAALEEARDAVTLDDDHFFIQNGNSGGTSSYINDPDYGTRTLTVVEYSLGAYTGRPSIAAVEVLQISHDYSPDLEIAATPFSTDLTEIVDVPSGGFFGQDSFRDDSKQLFGGWRRVDVHALYPSAPVISASVFLLPLSGHTFVTNATGTLTTDSGWTKLGDPFLDFSGLSVPRTWIWSYGPYTPPDPP